LPPQTFADYFEAGDMGTIRLIHYPGSGEAPAADVFIAPHTDIEAFTLMHQDAPGPPHDSDPRKFFWALRIFFG
jgi:isopenicillin N synthase-like dioxygenase